MLFRKFAHFGNRFEDIARKKLSHYPIIYAFIGGTGVVLFWRGIWHTVDFLMTCFFASPTLLSSTSEGLPLWWDGPLSIVIGSALLLAVGLFVSNFIGNEIIISGVKGEKLLIDKTEQEIKNEVATDVQTLNEIRSINVRLKTIEKALAPKKSRRLK